MKRNIFAFFGFVVAIVALLTGKVNANELEKMREEFQKAAIEENCAKMKGLFPHLLVQDSNYYNVLGNFYEKGICFAQDDKKLLKPI